MTSPHRLSRAEARRIAVRAQLLDARAHERAHSLLDVARQLTLLQLDRTNAVARSAELVAWSRLGDEHAPDGVDTAVDRLHLIDHRGLARPPEDMALYRADMAAWAEGGTLRPFEEGQRRWMDANEACRRDILAVLRADGPLPRTELPDTIAVPWQSSGWNNDRSLTMLLELMIERGDIAPAGRDDDDRRLWDLAERIYPDDPVVPRDEARRIRGERRLRSLGVARARTTSTMVEPNDVGEAGEPAVIDGVRGAWRVDPEQLDRPFAGRLAILSPLDRLVFDRKRMVELFEFDYQLEMYKPAAKRRWGYWAMPILYGDRLVGKIDATADRPAGVLRVDRIHRDVEFTAAMDTKLRRELRSMARWLDLEPVVVDPAT